MFKCAIFEQRLKAKPDEAKITLFLYYYESSSLTSQPTFERYLNLKMSNFWLSKWYIGNRDTFSLETLVNKRPQW